MSRTGLSRCCAWLFVGVSALSLAACEDSPVGPSLSAVRLSNMSLRSTTGNPGICCCRVTGIARNENTVPVHATIKFEARPFNDPDPLSTILYFIKDLQPGATHQIDAPGFVFPCNTFPSGFQNVRTEIEVRGITFPPG
jgi:hypothetical protein